MRWAAEIMGLASQHGMRIGADWRNDDLTEIDLLRVSGRLLGARGVLGVRVDMAPEWTARQERVLGTVARLLLLWGAGHLPGMGDVLAHNGFRLDSVRWIPAIRRPGRRRPAR